MKQKDKQVELPSVDQLQAELNRVQYKKQYNWVLRTTIYTLIVVAAVAVLVATIWMPVLQVFGTSMTPTLQDGEIVVSVKTSEFEQGDLVSFYIGNKLLVKRYIAGPGQWVNIDKAGNVYVDGERLDEPYLEEKAFGDCDIAPPYQVPDSRIFCMGDHRATSVDSRNTAIGAIAEEQIVGKIIFRVWPLNSIGPLS